ncbi:MAG: hypothetical protein RLZZ584_4182 [Pseudomonadota bacterium]
MSLPQPLISATDLREHLARPGAALVLIDCSHDLAQPAAGRLAYAQGHLPGARFAHLDEDLSAPKTGRNGRHPLPAREDFARRLGAWGVRPGVPVVVYDRSGTMYAARLWWMLRWMGHAEVAVLDGGLPAWVAAGGELTTELPQPVADPAASAYPDRPSLEATLDADTLLARLGQVTLIDARAAERYRGEVEPLDPVAGHIPGAVNRNFKDNLAADGRFLAPEALRAAFLPLVGDAGARPVVHQCGSGVTACHNLLAMAVAGLPGSALYPGSWSEWCADPARPVARG